MGGIDIRFKDREYFLSVGEQEHCHFITLFRIQLFPFLSPPSPPSAVVVPHDAFLSSTLDQQQIRSPTVLVCPFLPSIAILPASPPRSVRSDTCRDVIIQVEKR